MGPIGFSTGVMPTQGGIRTDGWINVLTGLGLANRDKRTGGTYGQATVLDRATLEEMYRGDSLAAKVVDLLPHDMVREWIEVKVDSRPDDGQAVMQALDDLDAQTHIEEALSWARLYGGAVIVLGVNDGQPFDKPLNLNTIQEVTFLNVLDRWQIHPEKRYTDATVAKYGKPELYRLQPLMGGADAGKLIHETRLIRFDGVKLPDRLRELNHGWGDTVLNRLFNALRGYHQAHDSIGTILADFTQAVYKLKNLAQLLSQNQDQDVIKRMQIIELTRSIARAIVLDEDESWDRQTTSVAGLPDLVDRTERRLVAETNMPHTLLLGESPGASLGEGGRSENQDWYDHVASQQTAILLKPLRYLVEVIMRAKRGPLRGRLPKTWGLEFRSLWQLDEKEQAEIRKTQSETDTNYINGGVLSAEEVAISRFGGDGYSTDTVLDMKARDELAAAADEEADDEPPGTNPPPAGAAGEPGASDPEATSETA